MRNIIEEEYCMLLGLAKIKCPDWVLVIYGPDFRFAEMKFYGHQAKYAAGPKVEAYQGSAVRVFKFRNGQPAECT
jgi:hypothetical protein